MKLGFVSAIRADKSFEEMIDIASDLGYACVEVACWPKGKAERRYAGVTHIDVDALDEEKISYIRNYVKKKNVEISSLAYYPNPMDGDKEVRQRTVSHLKKVIEASHKLGIGLVTTFIGRDQYKSVEENLEIFKEVWPPILKLAKEKKVKIAIENCPMLFSADQWPGGQNLFTTPRIWREIFEMADSEELGINFDPSHMVWQMMDYIEPLYEFKDRIFHVHFKDTKVHEKKLNDVGVYAFPLDYMSPKLPGYGQVDFGAFISALHDIGFDG
ncbi:MAG TPA: sugar phosphate isomerase/epimerase family protein, partial [Bacteroidales bacterium]|nr:sugar phosphate isomerase/epimerase family protein [Bacteroidales bacterium]